ncbi:MAG: hypothetical protein RMJ59_03665 [Candidatus Nitrosocaldus sp.]|nr:hypothetical protein [Candidatus Nitrosocaldus sp.]MDW8275464.1 hypothetical protein [Candidatus Nitrosocaldus sp.]
MVEVLWFEDIEPLRQPVFDFPLLGRISMKQMCIIGSALIISLSSRDILVAMVSLTVALFIAMFRYRALGMDELIYSLLLYAMRYKVYPYVGRFVGIIASRLLDGRMPRVIQGLRVRVLNRGRGRDRRRMMVSIAGDGNVIIPMHNPVRLRLRLLTRDGRAVANRLARIYMDDALLTSITSDSNGELDVMLALDDGVKEGTLRVYVDGYSRPLLEEQITVR